MQADGKGWLFAPKGLIDGPLPTHYEPQESPVANALYPQQQNPARLVFPAQDNLSAPSAGTRGADVYPYVFTTYRLTEHHTAGGMSRWLPYLSELQPEMFCEVSPELAAERGLEPYGWATIISARSAIEAKVLVTDRMTPLAVGGHTVHQIGLPYHWGVGSNAVVSGDAANDLLGRDAGPQRPDPGIQGRLLRHPSRAAGRAGEELLALVAEYQARAGVTSRPVTAVTDPRRLTRREDGRTDGDAWTSTASRSTHAPPGQPAPAAFRVPTRRWRTRWASCPDRPTRPPMPRWEHSQPRKGFFTDTSICIGCKACEVACKEWNHNPQDGNLELLGSSYDNTGALGASTWRHVAFIEQGQERIDRGTGVRPCPGQPGHAAHRPAGRRQRPLATDLRGARDTDAAGHGRLPLADVLRRLQALHARRLPRCLPHRSAFPHRVRHRGGPGRCLQRLRNLRGRVPLRRDRAPQRRHGQGRHQQGGTARQASRRPQRRASPRSARCATTGWSPTRRPLAPRPARRRPSSSATTTTWWRRPGNGSPHLHAQGLTEARLYGANENDGVGGTGSVFLLLDEPEVYGLPPDPRVPTADLPQMYRRAGMAVAGMVAAAAVAFLGGRA